MNDAKLTIRCKEEVEKAFRILCAVEDKKYGELLEELLNVYEKQTQN